MNKDQMMHALPVSAYTSQEWFDKEMKAIFSNTWQFAGFIEEVAHPGDFISVQAGLHNIFVVKGRDHRLRAFHNICRHRGTQLLQPIGKGKTVITCPYHDWTYDLEGQLMSIPKKEEEFPHLPDNLKDCNLNLHKAAVGIFKGMIFVHPDENAQSITTYFEGIKDSLGPHKVESLIEYSEKEEQAIYAKEIRANWKIVVENYIDHYHLAHLHKGTLNMYDHSKASFGWVGPHYWFYEPLVTEYEANVEQISPYVLIDSVPREKIGAYVPWLFPNLGLSETESTWSLFHITPIAPDKTIVTIRSKIMDASSWEQNKQYLKSGMSDFWKNHGGQSKYDSNAHDALLSGDFMEEDVYVCEQQQKSLQSPLFSIGARAKHGEYAIEKFQSIVKEWIDNSDHYE